MRHLKFDPSVTRYETDAVALYMKDIRKYPQLTREEEIELGSRAVEGDKQAQDKLVQSNLRFVVSVAKKYQVKGMELLDIISEGNIGLIKAAERFDPSRGFRFTSYAVCWVQQAIMLAISNDSRLIRIPANKVDLMHKINEFSALFFQKEERYPTSEEIAVGMDIPFETIAAINGSSDSPHSLTAPIRQGSEDGTLLDVVKDESAILPDAFCENEFAEFEVQNALRNLEPREREIIIQFYGLDGKPERSLEEIALNIGICKERIRQIKEVAIEKLKHSKALSVLLAA